MQSALPAYCRPSFGGRCHAWYFLCPGPCPVYSCDEYKVCNYAAKLRILYRITKYFQKFLWEQLDFVLVLVILSNTDVILMNTDVILMNTDAILMNTDVILTLPLTFMPL